MMPNLNGRDAYEQIKRIKPDIPVLFCSGYGDDLLKDEYMVEIEGRLLSKPYSSSDFLREIKFLLMEHSPDNAC
jgi:CheY-like chemotaxis protein